jgi:hypothetical protein
VLVTAQSIPDGIQPPVQLPIDKVLATPAAAPQTLQEIGRSRQGRPILGLRLGQGRHHVSLIGGCHADEPVGPLMLRHLAAYLASLPATAAALKDVSWSLVPHVNPDGEAANEEWSRRLRPVTAAKDRPDQAYDLLAYLDGARREAPGEDLEWSFPAEPEDVDTRPEALAVASFLRSQGPFHLHASFHSMGFAAGPWFLLEPDWIERTELLRETLVKQVATLGYRLHDVDRQGEKGFQRIEKGFCTRPDSRAMARYFIDQGDAATASLFRPSSMEFVRSLGGDPLTLVSEMPLFLLPAKKDAESDGPPMPTGTEGRLDFLAWAHSRRKALGDEAFRAEAERLGLRPMPLGDQMRLQLAFLNEGLRAIVAAET